MFSIERVELINFRSYKGRHAFDLPTEAGLWFLTGKNTTSPELGSNGSGKSTLLDAIFWCLYGRTTRGLKAGDVISWGEKFCAVSVILTVGDEKLEVCRAQNPNSLLVNDKALSQEALQKHLRLTPEAFLYAVILPQFGEAFFDLLPAAKLTLFSDIMGLDYWLERSQAADKLTRSLVDQRTKRELAVAKADGQRETNKADLAELHEKEGTFISEQAASIQALEAELLQAAADAKNDEAESKYCKKVLAGADEKIAKLVTQSICAACGQNVPNADLKAVRKNKTDFEEKLRRLQYRAQSLKGSQGAVQASIAKELERHNPYSEMIIEKKLTLSKLKEQALTLKAEIDKLNEEHAAVSFWVAGFKRVRLFIVEEALRQLELEVNNNLTSLGLTDWRVGFDVERENKSGGITKGFVVLVYPPGAAAPIRYESYSGGETQRLRLAGDLGLANLIMEGAGLTSTIEFYDEPSQHLSQEGLLDLAETLAQRAETQGKQVFLVDHHVVDFSGFAGTIVVTKGPTGSSIGYA